jgi:hypothetical protein
MDLPIAVAWAACAFAFSALIYFTTSHVWVTQTRCCSALSNSPRCVWQLILHAMTTIEYQEQLQDTSPAIRHRFHVAHSKWHRGWWTNWTHIFGPW